MSHAPEEDLSFHINNQERELHGNLFILNALFQICSDESLSEKALLKQALPLVDKLAKSNAVVAKEIKEVLSTGNRQQIKAYFEQEKEALLDTLSSEIKEHKGINSHINKKKIEDLPTDS